MTTVYADAYGFNASDATVALQAAIDSGADKVIVRNQGTPWLISSTIRLKSNQEIRFEPNVLVKAKSGSFLDNKYTLFQARGINNIKLVGEGVGVHQATLAMNKNEFSPSNNSYGHIIGVQGTDNYTISGLTLTGAGGDGIIIDAYSYGQPIPEVGKLTYSDRGLIENVTATNNRRNGLSVISAQNLTVQNSKFINSSDEAPAAGIDFEPDFSHNRLSNININNVDLSGNQGNGLSFILSALNNNSIATSININGAKIDNNEATGIKVGTYNTKAYPNGNNPGSTPNGVINISNVTIAGTKETNTFDNEPNAAISIQALSGDRSDPNNLKVNFNNVAISNTGFNTARPELSAEPIFIRGFGGPNNRNQIGNLSFNNVTVADNFDRDIIGIHLNQLGFLNNITGNIRGVNPYGVTENIASTATRINYSLKLTPAISPVVGTSGNDTFNPGKGAIAIDGGAGNDTLILDNSTDTANTTIDYKNTSNGKITGGFNVGMTFKNIESVMFASGSGNDKIDVSAATGSFGKVGVTTGAGNDTIIGSLTGIFNNYNSGDGHDVLTAGNGSGNTYNGGAGNDTLIAGGGADTLSGGSGNDTYIVKSTTNTITEAANQGTDTVQSSVTFSIATLTNIENLLLTGTNNINGTGNSLNNTIIGNSGNNILTGGEGNDYLVGGAGNDNLNGGAGNDTLRGDAGNDNIDGGVGTNTLLEIGDVNFTATNSTLTGLGTDTFTNIQTVQLVGGSSNNTINASTLTTRVIVSGRDGNDIITGGTANDVLYGENGDDTLAGGNGNDYLTGGQGNDTLLGGAGNDYLIGGAGNDTYIFNTNAAQGTDVIGEAVNGGIDSIEFTGTIAVNINLSVTTVQNIKDLLVLTVTQVENVTGGSGNDRISGNDRDNFIKGGGGNDFLTGGLGKDKFSYQTGATFNGRSIGIDTITDFKIGDDKLVVSKTTFTKLAGGLTFANVADDSVVNTNAAFVVYSKASGKLFYNENGTGLNLGAGAQFAQLTSGLNLTSSDFNLVS
jgi:Ca2+-binding RTX toxin-like protein